MPNIFRSTMVRNAGKLLSANVIAQAIGILVYPVLTRMYAPEDFGLLNLFMSIGGVLVIVASLDWFNAIVLPKTDDEARPVVHISLLSIAALTLVLLLSIPLASPIARLFNSPDLASYYWLLPAYVCLMSLWNVLNYWYIRRKAYGRISGYQVSQSLFSAGYKTGFGAIGWLNGGLISAAVLAPLCSLVVSISLSAKTHLRSLLIWDWNACRQAAQTYSNFPKYSAPRSLLNTLSSNLPTLMLTPVFGLTEIGFFGMALTLAFRPIQIVVQSVFQVLFQRTAQMVNERQAISRSLHRFLGTTALVLVPVFVGLYFILPWLTAWLLGDAWRVTGEYIRLLLPWIAMVVLATSINFIPDIFGRQRVMLWIEVTYLALRVLSLLIGIHLNSIVWAISLFSLSGVVILLGELIWFIVLARRFDQSLSDEAGDL